METIPITRWIQPQVVRFIWKAYFPLFRTSSSPLKPAMPTTTWKTPVTARITPAAKTSPSDSLPPIATNPWGLSRAMLMPTPRGSGPGPGGTPRGLLPRQGNGDAGDRCVAQEPTGQDADPPHPIPVDRG